MAIGVTYDEFWHGDPEILQYAIETESIRQKNQAILDDTLAWNTGRYVMAAVGVVLSQAFSKNSQAKYPSEPMLAIQLDKELAERKREQELRQMQESFVALGRAMAARKANRESA